MTNKGEEIEKVVAQCRRCANSTNHDALFRRDERWKGDYEGITVCMVIQCRGCDSQSFRIEEHDYESMRRIDEDEWEHDFSIKQYPQIEAVRRGILDDHRLPHLVRTIYRETVAAINAEHLILASIGLRSTIEAVCNDKEIHAHSLEARIRKLRTTGTLGKTDTDRLHSIRFLGNDAAHEIASPVPQNVQVALEIVEHLLRSLYLFDSHGSLERPFRDYADMKATLQVLACELPTGTHTLIGWLGKERRRLVDDKDVLEQQLVADVKANKFAHVTYHGQINSSVGSKKTVEAYEITKPPP